MRLSPIRPAHTCAQTVTTRAVVTFTGVRSAHITCPTCTHIARQLTAHLQPDGTPRPTPAPERPDRDWTGTAADLHAALDAGPGGSAAHPDTITVAVLAGPHSTRIARTAQPAAGRLASIIAAHAYHTTTSARATRAA